ncbi:MAG: AAA family ATPase, partial [Planctomycetota bacterium]
MSQTIAGYQVSETIRRGALSTVHRGLRSEDGHRVVIKVASSEYPSPADLDRLRGEFEVLRRIDHPGVVHALALEPDGRGLALVLEHAPGETLDELLGGEAMPAEEFLPVAIAITDAVAAVHAAEVIHKDLNPANILMRRGTGAVKIVDFGLSSVLPREAQAAVNPEALEGTLAYVSPEQTGRMNRSVDSRSDLYSLGVVFYRMLTGRLPFESDDPMELVHHHIARTPREPAAVDPSVPAILSRITMRLLEKTAEDRYQSAVGLRADLERCRDGLAETGAYPEFPLGERDVSGQFQISEKLYGRDAEIDAMLSAFETVGPKGSALMLVSGYSGVGKSRLVNELQKPIVERRGAFVSGKFDQFKKNVPFASLNEAFRELVRQILTQSDEAIAEWRHRLVDALGPNGRLIVDVVPEVGLIVGDQPAVPDLPPRETRNRFLRVLRAFVMVFCRAEHPLCLFLDDLQWVDAATLGWLEDTLTDQAIGSLFVIGAYRDNEVSPSHPLMVTLDSLSERGATIRRIDLQPLDPATLDHFVADTLRRDVPEARELARLVHERTSGNPFFVNQLLVSLHENGALQFDSEKLYWVPDLERVRAAGISDNVVDLMVGRIRRLSEEAQEVLTLAACVGAVFEVDQLVQVAGGEGAAVAERLSAALRLGLLEHSGRPGEQRFVHDRVQQAAYSLLSEDRAREVRLRIGRLLIERSDDPEQDDALFDALQHFDFARELIVSDAERQRLAELNFAAAVRARNSTAYPQALMHVRTAIELLPGGLDDAGSRLPFELTLERAECEHLAGNDETADRLFEDAQRRAADDRERARAYEQEIHFLTNTAQFDRAYATGREGAALFGIDVPKKFVPPRFLLDFARVKLMTRGRSPVSLAELPEMSDEKAVIGARLVAAALKAAYQIRPELCVATSTALVKRCLKEGNFDDSPVMYLPVGPIFQGGILGNPKAGYEWGQLCLALLDRWENLKQKSEVNFVYAYFAHSWVEPHRATEEYYRTAYQAGVETGDFFHASCAASAIVQSMFMRGAPLDSVMAESDRYMDFLEHIESRENIGTLQGVGQTIRNLRGETRSRTSYETDDFDETEYVASLAGYGSPHFAHYYFVNKLQAMILWREFDEADRLATASAGYLKASPGMQHSAEHHFLVGLLAAARGRRGTVKASAKRFRRWARSCPENFSHREKLLAAELARIRGQDRRAASLYDEAIEAAAAHGFLHHEALACELAGRFHADRGRARNARYYLRDAGYGYWRWGATALADALAERHKDLLPDGLGIAAVSDRQTTTGKAGADLDINTILKSAQAISGEVQLPELLGKLIEIVIENAGADRGLLLLPSGKELVVQAEGTVGSTEPEVMQGAPLGTFEAAPRSIVSYVVRSKETVVIEDAANPGRFAGDPYLEHADVRSILCAPLVQRGKLNGILYLENSLTANAFTEERTRVLQLLSGQFAISIQNAMVYGQLEEKVRERTAQLETRNRFIRQTFGRYLSEDIVERLLEAPAGLKMGGESREVTIMVADLRGFSTLAGRLAPEQVVRLINNYLGVMTEVIIEYGGTIDEFIGDAILVIFGAHVLRPDDAERSIACSLAMQLAMTQVNELNRQCGLPEVAMGIGLNTGEVVVGNIGSMKRAKYGVVGSNVNLASRIESYT